MGKWRTRYSRAPDDNPMSPDDLLTPPGVGGGDGIIMDPTTTLIDDGVKGAIIDGVSDGNEKLLNGNNDNSFWNIATRTPGVGIDSQMLQQQHQPKTPVSNLSPLKELVQSVTKAQGQIKNNKNANVSSDTNGKIVTPPAVHNGSVKVNGHPVVPSGNVSVVPEDDEDTNTKSAATTMTSIATAASGCGVSVRGIGGLTKGQRSSSDEEDDYDDYEDAEDSEQQCGMGPWCAPRWMQMFASKQAFLVTFCITWVLQGMYYTYFVSVITTIEKLFQIQSKTTGIIMSATEIGQIGSSLLLTYYGGQGHRPKWIAWGMVLFAVSSFTCSLPHFLFGKHLIHANDMLFGGVASTVGSPYGDNTSEPILPNICRSSTDQSPAVILQGMNISAEPMLPAACEEEFISERRIQTKHTTIVLAIFFISLLGVGMGQTAVYTLGIPYIDDNVASRESPLYFAITIGVRILGPALGFILGSLCTRLYADLSVDPQITPTDPRWVGAWWLGLVMVSTLLMLASLAMFSFPKRLSTCRPTPRALRREKKNNPSLRDFPKAVKRLLKNDILMFRTASSVLHILPIAGLYTFLPKYLESQFRQAAHIANMISGVGGILVMGLGIIISGVFILRVKPNARFVAAWIAFTAVVYAIGMGILMFIGCPMDDFAGLTGSTSSGLPSFEPVCNTTCECDRYKFSPICGQDGKTYFSACHAGCRNITIIDGKIVEYSDCLCMLPEDSSNLTLAEQASMAMANIGYCDLECDNFVWYIILFSIFVFIHSTSEVGSMLLILRCVDPRDKAMALGLIQFAIGLFGNVPCPIVYGAVVDSACLVWEMACGERGACWLYDTNVFRMFYHGTTGAILLCAFFMDVIVWYKAGSINFVDEQVPPQQEEELNPIAAMVRSETSV